MTSPNPFSQAMLQVADTLRQLQGPGTFDIVPAQLTIRQRTWPGGLAGTDPVPTNSDLLIPQSYMIRLLSAREIANSGGVYRLGDLKYGPITPSNGLGVGYTYAQLKPRPTSDAVEVVYILNSNGGGNLDGEYECIELDSSRRYSWFLILRNRTTTP